MPDNDKTMGIFSLVFACSKLISLTIGPTLSATVLKLGVSAVWIPAANMSIKFWNRRGEEQKEKLNKRLREAWDGMMLAEDMMRKEEGKPPLYRVDMPSIQRYRIEYLNERVWN